MDFSDYLKAAQELGSSMGAIGAGAGGLITVLLLANGYFIKKLVETIRKTFTGQQDLKTKMATVTTTMQEVRTQLTDVRGELKELRRLEADMAVMKYILQQKGFTSGRATNV